MSKPQPIKVPPPLIQLFAKPPVAGQVKTRLIPDIGASNATRVFRHCLGYALDLLRSSGCQYQIWLSEETTDDIFRQAPYQLQQGSDLGDRMLFALEHGLLAQKNDSQKNQDQHNQDQNNKVILIGSDCLDLKQPHIDQAIAALDSNDIVLLPTFDGGFALIGCRVIDPALFDQVEWSSSRVLQQTIVNAESLQYQIHLLEMVRDIDTLSDLSHYPELLSIIDQDQ